VDVELLMCQVNYDSEVEGDDKKWYNYIWATSTLSCGHMVWYTRVFPITFLNNDLLV
jgi:hypothetical protein